MKWHYLFMIIMFASPIYAFSVGVISCNTNSMYPTFDCHSKIETTGIYNYNPVQVGDIVRYPITMQMRLDNKKYGWGYNFNGITYILHRIYNITEKGFITKGDNNQNPDPWIVIPWTVTMKVIK